MAASWCASNCRRGKPRAWVPSGSLSSTTTRTTGCWSAWPWRRATGSRSWPRPETAARPSPRRSGSSPTSCCSTARCPAPTPSTPCRRCGRRRPTPASCSCRATTRPTCGSASRSAGAVGYLTKETPARRLAAELDALVGLVGAVEQLLSEASQRFEQDAQSARAARRFVSQALTGWDDDEGDLTDTVTLLVSELVTNAVLHAGSDVEVSVRLTPTAARIEVTDASAEAIAPRDADQRGGLRPRPGPGRQPRPAVGGPAGPGRRQDGLVRGNRPGSGAHGRTDGPQRLRSRRSRSTRRAIEQLKAERDRLEAPPPPAAGAAGRARPGAAQRRRGGGGPGADRRPLRALPGRRQ